MIPIFYCRLHTICFLALFFAFNAMCSAQTGYEAAGWNTKMLDHPEKYKINAPSANLKAQILEVKKRMQAVDEEKLARINYWNAGAPAYRWNQITGQIVSLKQELYLRFPSAWVNLAIYDATILAWKEKIKYKRARPFTVDKTIHALASSPSTYAYPCEHSVTAAAAAYVLAYFIPDKADSILALAKEASQSRVDAGIQFPEDVAAGWELGKEVAAEIIEKAKLDGSANKWTGVANTDPSKWTGKYPYGAALSGFVPIIINKADQFRPVPPPDFAAEMKMLKDYKRNFKSNALAYYWATTGPELWNDLVAQKMFEYRISDDAPRVAKIYAVLSTAYHDMAIAVFDAKYTYWGIRPDQYDTTYKPLIQTPPFPGYPSGHAAGAGTSAAVLSYFFPADAKKFQQIAQDCADSRFYAGIHFKVDNETGLTMGKELGNFVARKWDNK